MGLWILAAVLAAVALMFVQAGGLLWGAGIALWIALGYAVGISSAAASLMLAGRRHAEG